MKFALAAISLAAGVMAESAAPRMRNPLGLLGIQPVWQASLPNEVHINYDVPSYGQMSASAAMRAAGNAAAVAAVNEASESAQLGAAQSFLRGARATDVFFENAPLATATESSYQAILSSLESSLDQDLAALRASAQGSLRAGQSFLQTKFFPAREPQVNIQVDASRGELVDVGRLRSDLYAYAKGKLDAIEGEILKSA